MARASGAKSPPSATITVIVTGGGIERAEEGDRIHMLAGAGGLRIDLLLARRVARAQLGDPLRPLLAFGELRRERDQRQARVADRGDVGPPVQPGLGAAAVGGDEGGRAPHVLAVVEPEVAGHAGEQHAVGLAQRLAALVSHLQRVVVAEKPTRHARQGNRDPEPTHRSGQAIGLTRHHHGLTAKPLAAGPDLTLKSLGPINVKGRVEPVDVYAVVEWQKHDVLKSTSEQ